MTHIVRATDLGQGWVKTLRTVYDLGGAAVNVITSIDAPTLQESPRLRAVLDRTHHGQVQRKSKIYGVDTVAGTIFPRAFYSSPEGQWSPDNREPYEQAAQRLYERYLRNYPTFQRIAHTSNGKGIYFGRLVDWELPDGGKINQLDLRIQHLRYARERNATQWNLNDLVLAETTGPERAGAPDGLQMYRPTDHPAVLSRGFPCLAHIDVSVFQSKLHLTAVYRHQALITKGYGNLLGLAGLQHFMAQQTGYDVGELCMVGGFSDAELKAPWSKTEARQILEESEAALR